jgi:hypothetical protein
VQRLLASAWWDWPLERLDQRVDLFSNVKAFLAGLDGKP